MTADTLVSVVPKLRFPEFRDAPGWRTRHGNAIFDLINNRNAATGLPVLAVTQEHGAIPRNQIDYHVSVTAESVASYKEVCPGDFIISLRSFEGGIEYSRYRGICSPAYVVLRRKGDGSDDFFRHFFKSTRFIEQLTRNIEGLRDGKMVSYGQFSEQLLPVPDPREQYKIAGCLGSLDELGAAERRKLEALQQCKQGLMQELFPKPGKTVPRLRFPEFQDAGEWEEMSIQEMIDKRLIVGHLDGNHGELYPKSEEFTQDKNGIPYISANDFITGNVDFAKCKRLPMQRARRFKKGIAKDGDILFAHNATVGPVAKLSTPAEFVILSTTATYFRCNSEHLSNDFLKCCLVRVRLGIDYSVSSSCQASGEEADVGHEQPGRRAGECRFEVLGEPAAAAEPGESALHDPAPRQHFEPFGRVGALDDFDAPATHFGQFAPQLVAGVAAVGEDVAQPWIEAPKRRERLGRAVTVLHVGRMDQPAD